MKTRILSLCLAASLTAQTGPEKAEPALATITCAPIGLVCAGVVGGALLITAESASPEKTKQFLNQAKANFEDVGESLGKLRKGGHAHKHINGKNKSIFG